MGTKLFDQMSYIHFASGIVAYSFNINLILWLLLHTIFEISENTELGMKFINSKFSKWPGGKNYPDNLLNIIGDTIATALGWYLGYFISNDSLNDFAFGIIAYFWDIKFKYWFIIHPILKAFLYSNSLLFYSSLISYIGWFSAYYIDLIGSKLGWYSRHIDI